MKLPNWSWKTISSQDWDRSQEKSSSLFERLFGWDDEKVRDENLSENEPWNISSEKSEESKFESPDSSTDDDSEEVSEDVHLVKNSSEDTSYETYKSYKKNTSKSSWKEYPWADITETKIWKQYSVGVKALKLNNKYFTETLGYLHKWDILEQTSKENSYGCFEVVVQSAEYVNKETKGYVCKKWLRENLEKDEISYVDTQSEEKAWKENISPEDIQTSSTNTKIGDEIVFDPYEFDIQENIYLQTGDLLDQFSQLNSEQCFRALVVKTKVFGAWGKLVTLCQIK